MDRKVEPAVKGYLEAVRMIHVTAAMNILHAWREH
jgi:hypothetical protein